MDSFFVRDGDDFVATELTRGPWHRDLQHGGPPAALLASAIETWLAPGMQVARVLVEFLRPIPVGRLGLSAKVVRAGRKVQTLTASLTVAGVEHCRMSALAIRTTTLALGAVTVPTLSPPLPPSESTPQEFYFFRDAVGYHAGMEARIARGTMGQGPTQMWMRMRVPLLPDATPSPLQRVLIAADSGNGVSLVLDTRAFTFVNPDLTVTLHRPLSGEWVCLDAATWPNASGVGLAETRLWDESGPIGAGLQTLVIEKI